MPLLDSGQSEAPEVVQCWRGPLAEPKQELTRHKLTFYCLGSGRKSQAHRPGFLHGRSMSPEEFHSNVSALGAPRTCRPVLSCALPLSLPALPRGHRVEARRQPLQVRPAAGG